MRNLMLLMLAVVIYAAGCKSDNPTGSLSYWDQQSAKTIGLTTPTPPTPAGNRALYGTISNLNLVAGTFTLTTTDGKTYDLSFSSETMVLYKGGTTDLGSSALADGLTVTVTGYVTGLPVQAKVRATLIIIDNSKPNQDQINPAD